MSSFEKYDLAKLAVYIMEKRGLVPHFPKQALEELAAITGPAPAPSSCKDLRAMLWCSIDNDDSRDLDQLTCIEMRKSGKMDLWIAIADVDALVPKDSFLDRHAQINTTSVYTPDKIFPMLPDKLSTDLTSLNPDEDRLAVVVKVVVDQKGIVEGGEILQGWVRNHAKLTYNAVGAWLEGKTPPPEGVQKVPGLEEVLLEQHRATQLLKNYRHSLGALTLESPEAEAKITPHREILLKPPSHNLAEQLIEEFMIAANGIIAYQLLSAKIPSLRRVVRIPKRWDRIVVIAHALGEKLPQEPNSLALEHFLVKRKKADPQSFPELSLTVIKLLGRGEYVVERPGEQPIGHFGLALSEYAHGTAPNRRYPDLIAQRQCKALIHQQKNPYSVEELNQLAGHCTQQEDAAMKVERHMNKSAAALLLSSQIGTIYPGVITGAGESGTWIRVSDPPVEGRVTDCFQGCDVGDHISVRLVGVDVSKGYIDFVKTSG